VDRQVASGSHDDGLHTSSMVIAWNQPIPSTTARINLDHFPVRDTTAQLKTASEVRNITGGKLLHARLFDWKPS
jgi:hypothetical protein